MKRWKGVALAVVTSLLFGGVALAAEGKKKNEGDKKKAKVTEQGQAVSDLDLAAKLADYARRKKDATAMAVAAQIMKSTPVAASDAKKAGAKAASTTADTNTPEKLLAEAKAFAGSDAQASALIDKVSALAQTRGAVDGPKKHVDTVLGNQTDVFTVRFTGGEVAKVAVVGEGNTDLDLYIFDENDNLIVKDDDNTSRCYVEWTPRWTGAFKIKIKNRGSASSNYGLLTN